jgi:hypothetical protein
MSTITLDHEQREALRGEIAGIASGYGDFQFAFRRGERAYAVKHIEHLRRMVSLMDAIGWVEQPDAPAEQPVTADRRSVAWARRHAREMARSFSEVDPADDELVAYAAMRAIGGDA